MKHSERFALDHWLSEYPKDQTYQDVLELIYRDSRLVTPWMVVERCGAMKLIEIIESTRNEVESMMDDLVYGVCLSDKTEEQSRAEGAMT